MMKRKKNFNNYDQNGFKKSQKTRYLMRLKIVGSNYVPDESKLVSEMK